MTKIQNIMIAGFIALFSGCASTSFRPVIEDSKNPLGGSAELENRAAALKAQDAQDVQIVVDAPEGLRIDGGRVVKAGDSEYEVLGKVSTRTNGAPGGIRTMSTTPWYFYDFAEDESWREGYCWPQVPLIWVTLGVWSILPINYPCWTVDTNKESDIANRKMRLQNALRKSVKALGGDTLLYLGSKESKQMTTVASAVGNTGLAIGTTSESNLDYFYAEGYALKRVPRPKVTETAKQTKTKRNIKKK